MTNHQPFWTHKEIDDFFTRYASDPFFQGALFLAGGN